MLDSNSETLRRVLKADLHLASFDSFCWSAQFSNAFNGLQSSATFFFFFWWGLLHGPQQGPDRQKEKTSKTGKRKLLPKQKNPP